MSNKALVSALLNKKMDRQDFLKHLALGLVAVTGAGTALRVMTPKPNAANQSYGSAYGGSAYGGVDEKKIS